MTHLIRVLKSQTSWWTNPYEERYCFVTLIKVENWQKADGLFVYVSDCLYYFTWEDLCPIDVFLKRNYVSPYKMYQMSIQLHSHKKKGAIALYEQYGFMIKGMLENYYKEGNHAFVMTCNFEEPYVP